MRIRTVANYEDKLDNLFDQYRSLPEDLFIQSHWSRYLCILVSGYLEISVGAILINYVEGKASVSVKKYVSKQVGSLQNVKAGKIYDLVGSFSADWEHRLRTQTDGAVRDAIDSVVANRNQIAHGRDANISFTVVKGYYERCKEFIEIMESICH